MTDIIYPVGLRYATVFKLNANGRPAATSVTGYEGLKFSGEKAFNLQIPSPRLITHQGKDRVVMTDQLPTLEAMTAELRVSSLDYDVDALLTGVKKYTIEDFVAISRSTDMQGSEPEVGMLLYSQAKDSTGLRHWHGYIIPAARCIPIPPAKGENPEDHRYTINPSQTTKHLWGTALVVGTEGATEHGIVDIHGAYKPAIESFLGDGIEDQFALLHTAADNTYAVWVAGTLRTANITKTTTTITFTAPLPASNEDVVVLYGLAA